MASYNRYELCEPIKPHVATLWGGYDENSLRGSVGMTLAQATEAAAEIRIDAHATMSVIIMERILLGAQLLQMFESQFSNQSENASEMQLWIETNPRDIEIHSNGETWDFYRLKKEIQAISSLSRDEARKHYLWLFEELYLHNGEKELKKYDIGTLFVVMLFSVITHEDSEKYRPAEKRWARELMSIACAEFMLLCHAARR